MKKHIIFSSLFLFVLLFAACSGTRTGSTTDASETSKVDIDDTVYEVNHPTSLADILIRVPGVMVDETAFGTRVTIRGGAPLFVIDGVPVGRSYASAANAVSVYDIARVEVLKSPGETAIYGARGANGVIVITTGVNR
ncbi:MAG: TonB-dependent receptor plug domain-containing protein [Bacteroidota bacterium]